MDYPVVTVRRREVTGKGVARKLRALGYIPAVLYGPGISTIPLVVDPKEILKAFRGERGVNTVVRLEFVSDEQQGGLALVRQYSAHPVRRTLEHCDFMKVTEDTELTLEVPIRVVGKSEGEKMGARVSNPLARVRVRTKVRNVPAAIEVDVTPLGVGQGIMLSQVPVPEGVRLVYTRDTPVVLVRMGRAEKGPAEEAAAPAAEGVGSAEGGAAPEPAKP